MSNVYYKNIEISNVDYFFRLELKSKFTFIIGASGTGKSHSCSLVYDFTRNDGVNCNYKEVEDCTELQELEELDKHDGKIIFIDEDSVLFNIKGFYNKIFEMKSQFVIVSRKVLVEQSHLAKTFKKYRFSVKDIYKMVDDGNSNYMIQ